MVSELTTYAQNREDLYLYALLSNVKSGFYVDVGANHETLHSVTKLFYELGWKGINVEPNAKLISELKSARKRDINLKVGLSDKDGTMMFREYPDFDGLSTLSKEIQKLYKDRNYKHVDYKIPVTTLKSIFAKNKIKEIDFLKVDVEGHELAVLMGNDWAKYRPRVVLIEGTDRERCISFLAKNGYREEFFDGLNYYLVRDEDKKITIHNFAGAVLTKGIYTAAEKQLKESMAPIEEELNNLRIVCSQLENPGIKKSASLLKYSIKSRIKKSSRSRTNQ